MFKKENADTYKDLKNLEGKRIGMIAGTEDKDWLSEYKYKSVKEYKNMDELVDAVIKGEVDAAIEDYSLGEMIDKSRLSQVKSILLKSMAGSLATRFEDQALNDQFNRVLKDMWNDGSLYQIKAKYLPKNLLEPSNYSPYKD